MPFLLVNPKIYLPALLATGPNLHNVQSTWSRGGFAFNTRGKASHLWRNSGVIPVLQLD